MYRLDTYVATIRIGSRTESPSDYWRREVMSRRFIVLFVAIIAAVLFGQLAYASTVPSVSIKVYLNGAPLSNGVVEFWMNNTLEYRGVTDVNGSLTLTNISTGNYTVYIYHNGTVNTFKVEVTTNTTMITLNITDPASNVSTINGWNILFDERIAIIGIATLIILVLLGLAAANGKFPRRR